MTQPQLRVTSVTIGAAAPVTLAHFYARLLGWPVTSEDPRRPDEPAGAGWAQLRPPAAESGPALNFEWEREYVPPVWPSAPGEQQTMEHLDIQVDDLAGAVEWATQQGATLAEFQPQERVRVMLDPEQHPFCLWV